MTEPLAATHARTLLTNLARTPDPTAPAAWTRPATAAAARVRDDILTTSGQQVRRDVLHAWRIALDDSLDQLATEPVLWTRWRTPGTWLDCHLRLRSLLAHVVAKAFWDQRDEVSWADIDAERFLWGAR